MTTSTKLGDWWWKARWYATNPGWAWDQYRHAKQYPKVNQVIKYHDVLVRVIQTHYNRDDLTVRWYDDCKVKHEEIVSWNHCCEVAK
jgi:hypothetical protein